MSVDPEKKLYTTRITEVTWPDRVDAEVAADHDCALRLVMRRLHFLYACMKEMGADEGAETWVAKELDAVFEFADRANLRVKNTVANDLIDDMATTIERSGCVWQSSSIDCQYIPCDPYEYVFDMETHKRLGND